MSKIFRHKLFWFWQIGDWVAVLDAQSKSPVSKTSGWHQGQLSFSFFQIQSNEYQGLPGSDTVEPYLLLIKKGQIYFSVHILRVQNALIQCFLWFTWQLLGKQKSLVNETKFSVSSLTDFLFPNLISIWLGICFINMFVEHWVFFLFFPLRGIDSLIAR